MKEEPCDSVCVLEVLRLGGLSGGKEEKKGGEEKETIEREVQRKKEGTC